MRDRAVGPTVLCALLAVLATLVTGCGMIGNDAAQSAPGSLAAAADLHGQSYVVGGKEGDEQRLLCEMTIAALESAGAAVTDRCAMGGTSAVRAALVSGEINVYWEYTGTARASFLGRSDPLPDDQVYDEVRREDAERNGVVWLAPTRFVDAWTFAVAGPKAAQLRLNTLSDMAAYIRSGQPGTVCVQGEYANRDDGLAGLQRTYDVTIGPERTQVLDDDLIYQSTADGVCTFGEISTTNGRIPGLGLRILDDDRHYRVADIAAPTMRRDAFDRDPQVAAVLDPVSRALDDTTMRMLNGKVSADGMAARDVARGWLVERGFLGAP